MNRYTAIIELCYEIKATDIFDAATKAHDIIISSACCGADIKSIERDDD